MKARDTTWGDYVEVFSTMLLDCAVEWKCTVPIGKPLPSRELEMAIDAWCEMQARNMNARLNPPAEVCPWILARLACALEIAAEMATTQAMKAPPFGAASMVQSLCGEWNGAKRDQWPTRGRIKSRVWRGVVLCLVAAAIVAGFIASILRQ